MTATLLRYDAMRGEVGAQPLDYQALGGAVGFGYQVEIAFQLEGDAAFKISSEQGAGFARDVGGCFKVGGQELRAFLDQVLDVVFENEKIWLTGPCHADEGCVVILDDAADLLIVAEAHAYGRAFLDQTLEVLAFLKRMLGRARAGLATWFRTHFRSS
jgi:hypothetical protein